MTALMIVGLLSLGAVLGAVVTLGVIVVGGLVRFGPWRP